MKLQHTFFPILIAPRSSCHVAYPVSVSTHHPANSVNSCSGHNNLQTEKLSVSKAGHLQELKNLGFSKSLREAQTTIRHHVQSGRTSLWLVSATPAQPVRISTW